MNKKTLSLALLSIASLCFTQQSFGFFARNFYIKNNTIKAIKVRPEFDLKDSADAVIPPTVIIQPGETKKLPSKSGYKRSGFEWMIYKNKNYSPADSLKYSLMNEKYDKGGHTFVLEGTGQSSYKIIPLENKK